MRFVVSGMQHELDAESVTRAADRIVPDAIDGRHKYYVPIAGRRIPPKQLFAQATGLHRSEFITFDAIRVLRKLGFEVGEYDRPSAPGPERSVAELSGKREAEVVVSYAVSLEADEDGYIVASCPQFPGCHSQGRTRHEAIKNIEEAIRGYIASMKHHEEEIPIVDWELVRIAL